MNNDRMNLLSNFLKFKEFPILIEDVPADMFDLGVIIKSNCSILDLNGHYENVEFLPPKWYTLILEKSKKGYPVLVIDGINKISKQEQTKFIELLKYKKISTFDLPKNCIILVTAYDLKNNLINEEVYSLLVHI